MKTTQAPRPAKARAPKGGAPSQHKDQSTAHSAARFNAVGDGVATLTGAEQTRIRALTAASKVCVTDNETKPDRDSPNVVTAPSVHDDAAAHEAAELLGAEAFTLEGSIYLSQGAGYALPGGKEALLRHEMAHVAQQMAPSVTPGGGAPDPPPTGPPNASTLGVAGPLHPLEQSAMRGAARFGTAPRGLILRMPSHLPPTAGGQILGRHLFSGEREEFSDILTHLENEDYDALAQMDPYTRSEGEDVVARIREDFPDARSEISLIDDRTIAQQMLGDLEHDIASLIYTDFYDEDAPAYEEHHNDVTNVFVVYSNFVTLYRLEQTQQDVVSPYDSTLPDWFETRAGIFRDAALTQSSTPLYAVFAGLAADIATTSQEKPQGPERAAKMLIGHLFDEGISAGDMDAVEALYENVLQSLDANEVDAEDPVNAHWRLDVLRHYFVNEYLGPQALAIEQLLVASDDENATTLFRQHLGDEIAHYLANIEESSFTAQTEAHLQRLIELLGGYRATTRVTQFTNDMWIIDIEEETDDTDADSESDASTYGPGATTTTQTAPASDPAEEVCEGEDIDAEKVLEWLKMYGTDAEGFATRWNDTAGLICANRPYSDTPATRDVRGNLDNLTGEARIVLRRLHRQIANVRRLAEEIRVARSGEPLLFGPPTLEQQAEMEAETREEPDLIHHLGYGNEFYFLFGQALTRGGSGFDASSTGDRLATSALEFFQEMAYYQISLKAAVTVHMQMVADGMDTFIRGLGIPEDAALLDRIERYATQAEDFPDWPEYDSTIAKAQEIDLAVIRMEGIRDLAQAERDIDNIETLQARVLELVPIAVQRKRTSLIGGEEDSARYDHLRRSDIYPDPLRDMLPEGWETYRDDVLIAIDSALQLTNQGRLSDLAEYARSRAEAGDAMRSEAAIARFRDLNGALRADLAPPADAPGTGERTPQDDLLARFLAEDPSAQFAGELQALNFAATQHLLQLFMMVETARSGASGDARGPGRIIRQVNLLMILLDESSQKTLHGAVDRLDALFTPLRLSADPRRLKQLMRGLEGQSNSMLGLYDDFVHHASPVLSMFSSVTAAAGPGGMIFFETTQDVLNSTREGGTLHTLLQAEAAGGLDERAPFLEQIADNLRAMGGTPALTTARFIYADIMGVAHLIDEIGMPPDIAAAQTRQNQRSSTLMPVTENPDGTPAPTPAADEATISAYNRAGTAAMADLESGQHPTANRPLNDIEDRVFGKYRAITGDDHWHGVGDQDLSAAGDFAKQVAKMAAVIFITRGIGSGATAATGSRILGSVANMGAFTAIMRAESTLATGQYPHTSFAEDMIINLATEGIGQGTQIGYRALFGLGRNTARIGTRHTIGIFAAEMATSSYASMVAAGVTSRIFDRSLTNAQMQAAIIDNAGMMVAMRGVHVLGARATDYFNRRLQDSTLRDRVANVDLDALQREMVAQDVAIRDAARSMLDKTSDADRMAVLDDQLVAMERKLAILDGTNNREIRMLAESYRQGIRAHRRSVMQARLHIQINARSAGDFTPDQTYDGTPSSRAALARHLTDSGNPFSVRRGRFGPIYEVTLPNGTRVRYRPRQESPSGASRAGSYTTVGRIEGDEISANDPSQLMSILRSDNLSHTALEGAMDNTLTLGNGDFTIAVEILPVERHSSGPGPHSAGPARFELRLDDTGRLRAVVEVRTDVSNDQIVRAVNEEIRELDRISAVLENRTNTASADYVGPLSDATLSTIIAEQTVAGQLLRGGGGTGPLTADDIATVHGIGFLGRRLAQLSETINNPETPEGERSELYARHSLILADFQALWAEAGLPTDRAQLQNIVQMLDDANMGMDETTRGYLEGMRFTQAGHPQLDSPVTMMDLHILFSELQKANPHRFGGVTIRDFMNYYHDAIARRARADYEAAISDGQTPEAAADAQIASILNLIGGTSIPSARGRAFEGLAVADFNANSQLLQQFGRMYDIARNNFPTYDAVTVRGAANGFTMREIDLPGPNGTTVRHLQLIDADGTVFFQCHRGGNRAVEVTIHIRHDVQMWSMKATQSIDTFKTLRATGFSAAARQFGRMFLSDEGAAALDARVDWYNNEVSRLQALGADQTGHADHGRFRLMRWRAGILARVGGQTQRGRTNRSIDALLRTIRAETLDPNDVELITD